MTAAPPLSAALAAGRYDEAALRLLLGVLTTLHDTAPPAREALIDLLTREVRP